MADNENKEDQNEKECRDVITKLIANSAFRLVCFFFMVCLYNLMHFFLRRYQQPRITSDSFIGVLVGNLARKTIDDSKGQHTLRSIVDFGMMTYMLVLGIEMDPYVLIKAPTQEAKVAYTGMLSTFILASAITPFLRYNNNGGFKVDFSLSLSTALSGTASPVLTRLITSHKIGKSDIGRLVVSAGMYSDFVSTFVISIGYVIFDPKSENKSTLDRVRTSSKMASALIFQSLFTAIISPIFMKWVNNENPQGKPMKVSHLVLSVAFMTILCYCSPIYGYSPILSAFMTGVFLPREGRVSKWVVSKINYLLSILFYPIFFFWMGYELKLLEFEAANVMTWVRLVIIFSIATIGKVAGTVLSGALLGFHWPESVALGLILTIKGHFHVYLAVAAKTADRTSESTSMVIIIAIFLTVVHTPSVVAQIIKRARKRTPTHRMTLELLNPSSEFRILLCLHGPQNLATSINLMEISRGTVDPGIMVYVTDLVELTDSIVSNTTTTTTTTTTSNHESGQLPQSTTVTITEKSVIEMRNKITCAVESYAAENSEGLTFKRMLAVSTINGLPHDICVMAEEFMVSLVILPFHKTQRADGALDAGHSGFRYVNRKVLRNAPCTVGILVDRGLGLIGKISRTNDSVNLNVAVIFIGGRDDREALAYAGYVAQHPSVKLTVIRLVVDTNSENASRRAGNYRINIVEQEEETGLDNECFATFYERHVGTGQVAYMEKHLANSAETYSTLRSFNDEHYSLIIVGRGERVNSVLTVGMNDWQQCPELGPIGDVLSGPDFSLWTSILIIQHYHLKGELEGLDDDFTIMM